MPCTKLQLWRNSKQTFQVSKGRVCEGSEHTSYEWWSVIKVLFKSENGSIWEFQERFQRHERLRCSHKAAWLTCRMQGGTGERKPVERPWLHFRGHPVLNKILTSKQRHWEKEEMRKNTWYCSVLLQLKLSLYHFIPVRIVIT